MLLQQSSPGDNMPLLIAVTIAWVMVAVQMLVKGLKTLAFERLADDARG